jgi:hypothetical protein
MQTALDTALQAGAAGVLLLHCVSSYPASFEDANVRTIVDMAARFGCPIGLSDHTPGTAASVAAVSLGACAVEKHFTLARSDGGPDAAFSLEPAEFRALVDDTKQRLESPGRRQYDLLGSERGNRQFRRSLYVTADVAAGEACRPPSPDQGQCPLGRPSRAKGLPPADQAQNLERPHRWPMPGAAEILQVGVGRLRQGAGEVAAESRRRGPASLSDLSQHTGGHRLVHGRGRRKNAPERQAGGEQMHDDADGQEASPRPTSDQQHKQADQGVVRHHIAVPDNEAVEEADSDQGR